MNVFSEKSGDPLWKLVRKGTAQAFAAQNLRSAAAEAYPHLPCTYQNSCEGNTTLLVGSTASLETMLGHAEHQRD